MSTENQNQETVQPNPDPIPKSSRIPNVTIINVVLLIGLLVLYALNFLPARQDSETTATQETSEEISAMSDILAEGAFHIAFVHSDTLMNQYKLAVSMRSEFEAEQRRLESDLQSRQQSFQEEVESFQRQAQLGLITRDDAQAKEQELMLQQQELIELNDTYANRLMAKEMEMNVELYQKITDLLERFNQEMGYDYILGFSPGGGILYAREKHDVTREVLNRLNNEYDTTN